MRFIFAPVGLIAVAALALSACDPPRRVGQEGTDSGGHDQAGVSQNGDDTGNQAADLRLAEMHLKGEGVAQDPADGLRLLHRAANGPDISTRRLANFRLGELTQGGIPGYLAPSRVMALGYFQKSAADHYDPATSRITDLARFPDVIVELHKSEFTTRPEGAAPAGVLRGVELFSAGNYAAAFPIILFHARSGSIEAQWIVAAMYLMGQGGVIDEMRYKGWCYMAAQNGEPNAQSALGTEFYLGTMFPGSDTEAETWLTRAGKQGDAEAHRVLGLIALDPHDKGRRRDEQSALRHFEAAATAGSARAMLHLGGFYLGAFGTPRDTEKARAYYMAAADAGIPEAKALLLKNFEIVYEGTTANPATIAVPPHEAAESVPSVAAIPPRTQERPSQPPKARAVILPPVKTTSPPTGERPSLVDLYEILSPSVVQIVALSVKAGRAEDMSQGSGVVIRPDLVLTNCHVLEGSNRFGTQLNGNIVLFNPVGGDQERDLCVLRTNQALKQVSKSRSYDSLRVGEKVFAIGSPSGLENTLTEGIISGLRRDEGIRYIQTSAPISPGSSGGGLFDEYGSLIGITTFKLDGSNLNFAVAIDESEPIIARAE